MHRNTCYSRAYATDFPKQKDLVEARALAHLLCSWLPLNKGMQQHLQSQTPSQSFPSVDRRTAAGLLSCCEMCEIRHSVAFMHL